MRATLTPGASTVEAGGTLPLALANTGEECLRTGLAVGLRRAGGTQAPLNRPVPAIMLLLQPGKQLANALELPADLAPGDYWAVMTVSSGPEHAPIVPGGRRGVRREGVVRQPADP